MAYLPISLLGKEGERTTNICCKCHVLFNFHAMPTCSSLRLLPPKQRYISMQIHYSSQQTNSSSEKLQHRPQLQGPVKLRQTTQSLGNKSIPCFLVDWTHILFWTLLRSQYLSNRDQFTLKLVVMPVEFSYYHVKSW